MEHNIDDSVPTNFDGYVNTNRAAQSSHDIKSDSFDENSFSESHNFSVARDFGTVGDNNSVAVNSRNIIVYLEEIELVDIKSNKKVEFSCQRQAIPGSTASSDMLQASHGPTLSSDMLQTSDGTIFSSEKRHTSDGTTVSSDMLQASYGSPLSLDMLQASHGSPQTSHGRTLSSDMLQSKTAIQQKKENITEMQTIEPKQSNACADLVTKSCTESMSKASSMKGTSASLLSVHDIPTKENSSKMQRRRDTKHITNRDDYDDYDDISMVSLTELLGTVRQYAKEIHEIYAPIKKDEEERIRKKMERNSKQRSKDMNKYMIKECDNQQATAAQHEVRVEIHKSDDTLWGNAQGRRDSKSKKEMLSLSKRHELLPTSSVASLHVENEKLSSTWPRGQRKSTTRERFWSEMALNKHKSFTPLRSGSFYRPAIPTKWSETNVLKHEKEVFDNSFRRHYKSNDSLGIDTSTRASSRRSTRSKGSEIVRKQMILNENVLPTISIIPPPEDSKRKSLNVQYGILSSAYLDNDTPGVATTALKTDSKASHDVIIPTATVVASDVEKVSTHETKSKKPETGVKTTSKVGLRRRKSVDQGLRDVMLEKY